MKLLYVVNAQSNLLNHVDETDTTSTRSSTSFG